MSTHFRIIGKLLHQNLNVSLFPHPNAQSHLGVIGNIAFPSTRNKGKPIYVVNFQLLLGGKICGHIKRIINKDQKPCESP